MPAMPIAPRNAPSRSQVGGRRPRRAVLILIFVEGEIAGAGGAKRAGQRASVLSPQARTIAITLPRQTIALAARGAPIQLLYKQKIPSEPRTRAIPNHATRDRRSAKFMLSVIRKCCQSASVLWQAPRSCRHRLATYSASAKCLPS
jgi:hypothetical protein